MEFLKTRMGFNKESYDVCRSVILKPLEYCVLPIRTKNDFMATIVQLHAPGYREMRIHLVCALAFHIPIRLLQVGASINCNLQMTIMAIISVANVMNRAHDEVMKTTTR